MALQTPSPTLYVSGLEGKTKKPELRAQLYALFNPYGRVIDVVAKKHNGGRGQAFVVFAEQAAATAALRGLTGELFYNKELRISYAKKPSHATLARQDPSLSRDKAAIEAAKMVVSRAQGEYEQLEKERENEDAALRGEKRDLPEAADGDGGAGEGERQSKRMKGAEAEEDEDEEEMEIEEDDEDDDKPKLICTNLPPECNADIMSALYSQYPGFISASSSSSSKPPSSHPKPNKGAISFTITFESTAQAQHAVKETQGYLMQAGWAMGVSLK
ncbi:hypothetical protein I317_01379 [Kwoniella heveanensis CBS 569]|uniref:RRM domain-containing protein n=1 Tax=Kwoniella heveanensis BCC8398 TaxID=1296120 RepID=A0A1B9GW40_9TREE|nr:hypothetical protein I316_02800 [Kwoniella heveanensis BCC8398]OCF44690.1 hypothetical protein I317_01379 [Kwoniella heveanensis CBS 569]